MFQYTEIQKNLCIETWRFKNFRVLYTQVYFEGQYFGEIATDDAIILGCESGDWVLPIYEKNRVQKSPATVPLSKIIKFEFLPYISFRRVLKCM